MRIIIPFLLTILIIADFTFAQSYKILESSPESIKIEVNFDGIYQIKDTTIDSRKYQMILGGETAIRKPGEPWLPQYILNVAIPFHSEPDLKIIKTEKLTYQDKFILPFPEQDPAVAPINTTNFDKIIYSSNKYFPVQAAETGSDFVKRYSRILPVEIAAFQYNPVTHALLANRKVIVVITYNSKTSDRQLVSDKMTDGYLKSSVINYNQALQWTSKEPQKIVSGGYGNYWYNPDKNYFKIYLKDKGVYRLTYDQLINSGVPIQGGVSSNALELVNEGNEIPLDVFDGGDGVFNSGDYLQFVGGPPSPTPYSSMNIYNKSNVYWFSYQSDTLTQRYEQLSGYPQNWSRTFNTDYNTIHYEKDSIYERLGYAGNDHRDFWFWGKATAQGGQSTGGFQDIFSGLPNRASDSPYVNLQVAMQGMTLSGICENNHDAEIQMTDQLIGHALWSDQDNIVYQKNLYVSEDSIHIYPQGNTLTVYVRGNTCETSDEIRINWYQFKYWRNSRAYGKHFEFVSPPDFRGVARYWITQWLGDDMRVYIPGKSQVLTNPEIRNDQYHSALFIDNVSGSTAYYCASGDYFMLPDSIRQDVGSDLRNPSNGADYIIITHPDFLDAAQRLKTLREAQYPDTGITSPRIKIVDVNQIYDEFSYGLLDPQSLQYFVKYAFENWEGQTPAYVVLFGDMSHDYRHLLTTSRPNFVPSIPFYVNTYGRAPSDNLIVDVAGNDLAPDLAIGRMSCETPEEADILMNKLENYPADNSKSWKQDVMLASSGLSLDDELHFHFNQYSNRLADYYLIPNGIHPSRVFNFPSNHQDSMYVGGGPKIRQEIDEGVVLGNYYGHGGGYQWDLIFTNDDIELLQNDGRLPVILSVTCYTAHFDDQDVFGEIFNKVPGRGSIGFFGNTVLTYWPIGAVIDEAIFKEIFTNRHYAIGNALFNAKNAVGGGGYYGQQITLLTYLGDPGLRLALPDKPDFVVKPSDISLSKKTPLVNDTVTIKARINNLGLTFPGDSVNVRVFVESPDTSYLVSTVRLPNFGELDSVMVDWVPHKAALYSVKVDVNELDPIPEDDHSDNSAAAQFVVYNVSEANILYPLDGYTSSEQNVKFRFVDIGYFIYFDLTYYVEIDTSTSFNDPLISSGPLTPSEGLLDWTSPQLNNGVYFWRVKINDGVNEGNWSSTREFSVRGSSIPGYFYAGKGLTFYNTYNMNYSDSSEGLVLNTTELPPRPDAERLIDSVWVTDPVRDSTYLTTITTDGTYIYSGALWFAALRLNPEGKSHIYKFGTGNNGTQKGRYYGQVPNFFDRIQNSIFYYPDGFIYVATSNPYQLIKVNPSNGDTSRISISAGLLDWEHAVPMQGSFYVKSDGQYVYNLTRYDSLGHMRYVLRVLDPSNNWELVKPDIELLSTSYPGFTDFLVADGYIYPAEFLQGNLMRRIRASDGYFEEEWVVYKPFQSMFAWCYDWVNNKVYSAVYRASGYTPKFFFFKGKYIDSKGTITSNSIGPASNWKSLSFNLVTENTTGSHSNMLLGQDRTTKSWDTLDVNIADSISLVNVSALKYPYLRMSFKFIDSTFSTTNQMALKSIHADYDGLPEIMITRKDLDVSPDSVLQGLNTTMHFSVKNIGYVPADSVRLNFYLNDSDSTFFTSEVNLDPDSTASVQHTFSSTPLIFDNTIKAIATYPESEYFTFNNIITHDFYIVRDSTNPVFNITFDGREIISGDLVSSKPEVVITLKDNSPLPLDTSYFTLIHTADGVANILHFSDPDLNYTYSGYPNSEAKIIWHPTLAQGDHILEILAKDASGNFFDSTSYRVSFEVVTEYDLRDVYNYPNPFTDGTYFTFKVTGDKLPDELYVKIYTVAGRLIKTINIPSSALGQDIGFKKIYWDGKDEDGDKIANGVYFYKMIYKVEDVVKSITQKLAKIK